jgi:hypothetical protein
VILWCPGLVREAVPPLQHLSPWASGEKRDTKLNNITLKLQYMSNNITTGEMDYKQINSELQKQLFDTLLEYLPKPTGGKEIPQVVVDREFEDKIIFDDIDRDGSGKISLIYDGQGVDGKLGEMQFQFELLVDAEAGTVQVTRYRALSSDTCLDLGVEDYQAMLELNMALGQFFATYKKLD